MCWGIQWAYFLSYVLTTYIAATLVSASVSSCLPPPNFPTEPFPPFSVPSDCAPKSHQTVVTITRLIIMSLLHWSPLDGSFPNQHTGTFLAVARGPAPHLCGLFSSHARHPAVSDVSLNPHGRVFPACFSAWNPPTKVAAKVVPLCLSLLRPHSFSGTFPDPSDFKLQPLCFVFI